MSPKATPNVTPEILRPGEFRARLGLSNSRFCELQAQGRFKHLESPVSVVLGVRAYSRRKVDQFFEGEQPRSFASHRLLRRGGA